MPPFSECTYPWFVCNLYPETGINASSCCHIVYPTRPPLPRLFGEGEQIQDFWNSKEIRKLRRDITNNTPSIDICHGCATQSRLSGGFDRFIILANKPPHYLDRKRLDNLNLAYAEYTAKKETVTALPVFYHIRFGWMCNLDCIMCGHNHKIKKYPEQFPSNWLIKQKSVLQRACSVSITGGEPFVIPEARKFLDWWLDEPSMAGMKMHINTNAYFLDQYNQRFARRAIGLTVSLDSYGKHYEAIRRNSSWSRVAANVEQFFVESRRGESESTVSVYCTIMRSGLPGLLDLLRWTLENGMDFRLSLAQKRPDVDLSRESFLVNPSLLLETPEWHDIIESCIEYLRNNSINPFQVLQMEQIKNTLLELESKALELESNALKEKRVLDTCMQYMRSGEGVMAEVCTQVYSCSGLELSNAWNVNCYGAEGIPVPPTKEQYSCGMFHPASKDDHVGTPFFPVPEGNKGESRGYFIKLLFPDTYQGGDWLILVQNDKYLVLAEISDESGEKCFGVGKNEQLYIFALSDHCSRLRLVFYPLSITRGPLILPNSINIEMVTGE